PSGVLVWAALWTVYIVWGSTYLALRVLVETIPPLVSTGSRFLLAGTLMLGVLALRNRSVRIARREALSCTLVGSLLMGAVATVATAEQDVPSNLAALLVACVPLWVLLLRRLGGEQIAPRLVLAVVIGFAGVGLLLQPGGQSGGAPLLSLLLVVCSTPAWATGSYLSSRVALPSHPLVSVGWQMLLGGSVVTLAGVVAGEPWALDPSTFSTDSMIAWLYLTVIGSGLAFTAYTWLLQNAPISRVATYAYVNPVVAIVLGYLILDEAVTGITAAGAAVIVLAVAVVVRGESRPPRAAA
ncbi:MAG TPA: EamA family transporter, partial [Solirubrobacteraceae bacterium]|nr:EamA family transporter [Solirubrobacteraceae bacterium]